METNTTYCLKKEAPSLEGALEGTGYCGDNSNGNINYQIKAQKVINDINSIILKYTKKASQQKTPLDRDSHRGKAISEIKDYLGQHNNVNISATNKLNQDLGAYLDTVKKVNICLTYLEQYRWVEKGDVDYLNKKGINQLEEITWKAKIPKAYI